MHTTILNLQPHLKGSLIELRPLTADDFEELYAVASDPLIWEQHPVPTRYQRDVYLKLFQEFIESHGTLVILDAKTKRIIGSSRYYDSFPEKSSVAIGFTMLARQYWGGIYNRELKTMMLRHAFQAVSEVIFHVGENNLRSQKALKKIGATSFDQSIKMLPDGREQVSLHYKILRDEWLASCSTVELKRITADDLSMLQSVLEESPRYYFNIYGERPQSTAAKEIVEALPPRSDYENKFVLGIYLGNELVGCIDLIRGYPSQTTAWLGLLLISEKHQGKGLGRKAFQQVERMVMKWDGVEAIQISVVESNAEVLGFWKKLGFKDTKMRRPYSEGKVLSELWILEKSVDRKFSYDSVPSDFLLNLQTERVTLEPITTNHAQDLCALFSDPELHRFVPFEIPTLEQQLERCKRWERRISPDETEIWINWAARQKQSGDVIGHFQAGIKTNGVSSIGYVVAGRCQNKGIATEALSAIFEFLREQVKMREVRASSDARNVASHRLAKKMGMIQVDLIHSADFFKGSSSDEFVFSKALIP